MVNLSKRICFLKCMALAASVLGVGIVACYYGTSFKARVRYQLILCGQPFAQAQYFGGGDATNVPNDINTFNTVGLVKQNKAIIALIDKSGYLDDYTKMINTARQAKYNEAHYVVWVLCESPFLYIICCIVYAIVLVPLCRYVVVRGEERAIVLS